MPYVDGESLRDRMTRESQLSLDDVFAIARQVADVLDFAHEGGIIHRDIKPENILLSGEHVMVADFGIARAVGTAGEKRLTETGLALGTPAYMSPEQSLGEAVDRRTDVYALGCVVYEMLVGEPPYTGPTAQAIIARRLSEPVPRLRVVRDAVPPGVEHAVNRALARAAADRYTGAGQFVTALTALPPDGKLVRSRRALMVSVAASLVVLVGASWFALRPAAVPVSASVIALMPLSTAPNSDTALAAFSHSLVSALEAGLGQVPGIRIVNAGKLLDPTIDAATMGFAPAARAAGLKVSAHSVLVGKLRRIADNRLSVDLKLLATDSSSDTLAVVAITGSMDSIYALTDSVSWSLLRQIWRRGTPPSASLASVTTRSLPALAAFLDGERLGLAGRWVDAAASYDAAFRFDSTFWLAAWRHNQAQQWISGEPDVNDTLQAKYEAHLASFGERDRLLISGEQTSATEPYAKHLKRFEDIAARFPGDWAAVWPLADHLVHGGPLVGHANAEARAALARTVALNPRLVNAWEHLYFASVGHDSAQSDSALRALMALNDTTTQFAPPPLMARLAAATEGRPGSALFDSVVTMLRIALPIPRASGMFFLEHVGYPGRQIMLNRVLMSHDTSATWYRSLAEAWAERGVWDSALTAITRYAAAAPGKASPVDVYRYAVAGAWLGGLDVRDAVQRRAPAVASLTGTADTRRISQLAWCDALLAILQSDSATLGARRKDLQRQLGTGNSARFIDRTLAAFQLLLRKQTRAAADSLAVIDLGATEAELLDEGRDGFARSISHFDGARLLLQLGDTSKALQLLTWHQADAQDKTTFLWFEPAAYLMLGRIADAQHRKADAITDYRQFLQRYDLSVPATRPAIEDARRALGRLYGLGDAPTSP